MRLPDVPAPSASWPDDRYQQGGGARFVYVGSLALDLLLGDVRSLKEKRSVVRPVVAELRRKFEVSAAEAGHLDLHRRALVGVAVVAADAGHVRSVLDACERLVANRPELEVLSARQRLFGEED
jgi:uncharacterized protein YlxP (DUF503 family)